MNDELINAGYIINSRISAISFMETRDAIEKWIQQKESKYVCICNTHSIVTASKNQEFNAALENAGLCTPDGMPLVWALRLFGYKMQDRVDGPNLMLRLCELAEHKNYKVFLYGGKEETLERLEKNLLTLNAGLEIVGKYSPPFRELTNEELTEVRQKINGTNADLVFVSLGCPKQEIWMYQNEQHLKGVMLGVGAAFDFIAGDLKRPPVIVQRMGFEWLYRLISEPKRLWKRYLYNNTVYLYKFIITFKKNKIKTEKARLTQLPKNAFF